MNRSTPQLVTSTAWEWCCSFCFLELCLSAKVTRGKYWYVREFQRDRGGVRERVRKRQRERESVCVRERERRRER